MTTITTLDSALLGDFISLDPGSYSFSITKSVTLQVTKIDNPVVTFPTKDVQKVINEKLKAGNVKLPAGLYYVSDSILMQTGRTIEGTLDSKGNLLTTLKLEKGLKSWGGVDIISKKKAMFMNASGAKNITLKNLIVDGSQSDYYPSLHLGANWFNMSTFIGVDGLTVDNVTWKNGCNDAMLIAQGKNISVKNSTVNKCGHDGVYAWKCNKITVDSCKFINRANSSTRFDYVTDGTFTNNDCTTSGGGYAGLELEDTVTNIRCTGNYFHDMPWGIARVHTTEKNVVIKGNKYKNVKNGVLN